MGGRRKQRGMTLVELIVAFTILSLVGLGIMRYAVRSEPLHSMDVDALVDAVAPTLQRYLTGDLS